MLADPPHLSQHQRAPSPPPLSSSCSSHRSAKLKTSNPCNHRNQQYSIIGLTNAAGTLVERYAYSAYGTLGIYAENGTVRTTSTYNQRYTYTGRLPDPDLNLYHFRARWYDPTTGGFISRDPLGYEDGMSLYRGYFGLAELDAEGTLLRVIGDKIPSRNPWNQILGVGNLLLRKKFDCECECTTTTICSGTVSTKCSVSKEESVLAFGYASALAVCQNKCASKDSTVRLLPTGVITITCNGRLKGTNAACALLDNYCMSVKFSRRIKCLAESRELCKCLRLAYSLNGGVGVHGDAYTGGFVCTDCSRIFRQECFDGKSFRYFQHLGQAEYFSSERWKDWIGLTQGHKWDLILGVHSLNGERLRPGNKGCAVMTVDYFNGAPAWDLYSPIVPPDWWGPGQDSVGKNKDNISPKYPDHIPGGGIW